VVQRPWLRDGDVVVNVRIRTRSGIGDALLTYFTAGLLISRTVRIEGDLVRYR